jgi:hypothetical protein
MNADVYIKADKTMYRVENSEVVSQQIFPQHPFVLFNRETGNFEDIAEDVAFILFKRP